MSTIPLKNQIIEWLKNQPYWLQYSSNILLEGDSLSDENIEMAYNYFKEDVNLKAVTESRHAIRFNEVAVSNQEETQSLKLLTICNIENVNALAQKQKIEINEKLTIILVCMIPDTTGIHAICLSVS